MLKRVFEWGKHVFGPVPSPLLQLHAEDRKKCSLRTFFWKVTAAFSVSEIKFYLYFFPLLKGIGPLAPAWAGPWGPDVFKRKNVFSTMFPQRGFTRASPGLQESSVGKCSAGNVTRRLSHRTFLQARTCLRESSFGKHCAGKFFYV